MGLKKYTVGMVILLTLIGFFANSVNSDEYTIAQLGTTFSVAVWVMIPALIVFILSLAHMIFYSFKGYLKHRTQLKDTENFKNMIENKILNKEVDYFNFKTENFKQVGELSSLLKFDDEKCCSKVTNNEINSFLQVVNDVKNGVVVDLKKYGLDELNTDYQQNQQNILDKNPKEAVNILKEAKFLDTPVAKKAFLAFVGFATKKEIDEIDIKVNKQAFEIIINRYIKDDIELKIEDITTYLNGFFYESREFIYLAKRLKEKLNPDSVIVFFDNLYAKFPNALEGYLYLLFELQMIDSIREIITDCQNEVCQKYKHLLFLRDSGKSFHIELFT